MKSEASAIQSIASPDADFCVPFPGLVTQHLRSLRIYGAQMVDGAVVLLQPTQLKHRKFQSLDSNVLTHVYVNR